MADHFIYVTTNFCHLYSFYHQNISLGKRLIVLATFFILLFVKCKSFLVSHVSLFILLFPTPNSRNNKCPVHRKFSGSIVCGCYELYKKKLFAFVQVWISKSNTRSKTNEMSCNVGGQFLWFLPTLSRVCGQSGEWGSVVQVSGTQEKDVEKLQRIQR